MMNPSIMTVLQQDLQFLQEWADKWLMTFNATKCQMLQISLNALLIFIVKPTIKACK